MLKTLQITSLIVVILAICGVGGVVVFGLRGDPEIRAFLEKPSLLEQLKTKLGEQKEKEDVVSPLVAQAKLIALRIDPPPPPKPKEPPKPTPAQAAAASAAKPIPTPPVQVSVKFDLLGTVQYETAPEKSMALVSAGNKQEWFRQGEKVGQQEIKEIRNGSVIFTQGGRNPQEVFVPIKTEVKSLLKSEQKASTAPPDAERSVIPTPPAAEQIQPEKADAAVTETGTARVVRSRETSTPARAEVAERARQIRSRTSGTTGAQQEQQTQRVRTVPSEPSVEEQKASIENSITSIQEIMSQQGEGLSEEERRNDQQMWANLLNILESEKQAMEEAAQADESVSTPAAPVPVEPKEEKSDESEAAPVQPESPAEPNEAG
jgi:hypothetical protein